MAEGATREKLLVVHDGELGDVCALLQTLRLSFEDQCGSSPDRLEPGSPRVVVGTPQRLMELRTGIAVDLPRRVAIVDRGSRTLVSMLRRRGVETIVQRPVHPSALRLLLLHLAYRGPEKRRRERVSVGVPVRFRAGWMPRRATLAELSVRGCRLLAQHAPRRDSHLQITIPGRWTGGDPLRLRGRVVRTGPASGEHSGTQSLALVFQDLDRKLLGRLQSLVAAHAHGPARLPASGPECGAGAAALAEAAPVPDPPEPGLAEPGAREPGNAAAEMRGEESASDERRSEARRHYGRSVIALGEEAARVLLGRDLSLGGMRVEPHDSLVKGDRVRIALHSAGSVEPLVLDAVVDRDDGSRGQLLRFEALDDSSREALDKLIRDLPLLGGEGPIADSGLPGRSVVISELLERS